VSSQLGSNLQFIYETIKAEYFWFYSSVLARINFKRQLFFG